MDRDRAVKRDSVVPSSKDRVLKELFIMLKKLDVTYLFLFNHDINSV